MLKAAVISTLKTDDSWLFRWFYINVRTNTLTVKHVYDTQGYKYHEMLLYKQICALNMTFQTEDSDT